MSLMVKGIFDARKTKLTLINPRHDVAQLYNYPAPVNFAAMLFSKSFGYALRGILYITTAGSDKKIQLGPMAGQLGVPRHFLGKVMKILVKGEVLGSLKGPYGGFFINNNTLQTSLYRLIEVTGEAEEFSTCALHFRKCNAKNPCPLHIEVESIKKQWQHLLSNTTIADLLKKQDHPGFLRSLTTI